MLRRMVFVREDQAFPDLEVRHVLQVASWFHPNWSEELAGEPGAAVTAGALAATWAGAWPSIGRFLTTLSAAGLTGVLAALAVGLAAGGFVAIRRITV